MKSRKSKIMWHYRDVSRVARIAICGANCSAKADEGHRETTTNRKGVTCKNCLKILRKK